MSLTRHIPNALTCCNLICGCLGIISIYEGASHMVPWLVIIAGVFDFFDGFAARILKVNSPIGKELDSLADMVTFGVLPAMFMHDYLTLVTGPLKAWEDPAVLIAVFSALRLAKFNVDPRQVEGFIGVPTPANAIFFIFLPSALSYFRIQPTFYLLIAVILLFCYLMVCPLPLFSLKFKSFSWKGNEVRFTFLAAAVLLIAIFKEAGMSLTIILYVLTSLVTGLKRPTGT